MPEDPVVIGDLRAVRAPSSLYDFAAAACAFVVHKPLLKIAAGPADLRIGDFVTFGIDRRLCVVADLLMGSHDR